MEKSQKNYMSIKSKLMAAVAMLLVASFMVVSSTYAWFTLSTAPEVTGITTKVGANGSLEIALVGTKDTYDNPAGKINSSVGDSSKGDTVKNLTWGNIVNLSDAAYGLDLITLLPSVMKLNSSGETYTVPATGILATPKYGADGRISVLEANSLAAAYSEANKGFVEGGYGVRAIGNMSSMTQQQLLWRQSVADVKSNLGKANTLASTVLNEKGSALAGIVFQKANDAATYNITAIGEMIVALKGTDTVDGVTDYLEAAMKNYLIAGAAIAGYNMSDEDFNLVVNNIEADCKDGFPDLSGGTYSVSGITGNITLPDIIKNVYAEYESISAALTAADTAYNDRTGIPNVTTATWDNVSDVLIDSGLVDIDNIKVNGFTSNQLLQQENGEYVNMNALVKAVLTGGQGIQVELGTGTGVYYDIAQVTGEVKTTIKLDESASIKGFNLDGAPATMKTVVEANERYDLTTSTICLATSAPADRDEGAEVVKKLSEYSGYVVDLAFRTNAAGSQLMLQTDAANRIYSDSTNSEIMGNGSTMSFGYSTNFDDKAVVELMKSIRMVITDNKGTVIGYAMLDTTEATLGKNAKDEPIVIAPVKLCEAGTVTIKTLDMDGSTTTTDDVINVPDFSMAEPADTNEKGQTAIMELQRNTETVISVYVYLDGETVDNGDVATGEMSMTGSLNLQFSSDANLTPMSYAPLQGTTTTESSDANASGGETPDPQG